MEILRLQQFSALTTHCAVSDHGEWRNEALNEPKTMKKGADNILRHNIMIMPLCSVGEAP
jgi:hypothetical protein